MARSDTTYPQLDAFIADTLNPWLGAPAGGVRYSQEPLKFGLFNKSAGGLYNPRTEEISLDVTDPYTAHFRRQFLVHEFTHNAETRRMEVPFSIWRSLLPPEVARQQKVASLKRGEIIPGTWLKEDFAYAAQDVFQALDNASRAPTEKEAISELNGVVGGSKRHNYLAARWLTRRDSPYYNMPYRDALLRQTRLHAEQRTADRSQTEQKLTNAIKQFVFAGTQIHGPTSPGFKAISLSEREKRYAAAYERMQSLVDDLAALSNRADAQRFFQETKARIRRKYGLKGD